MLMDIDVYGINVRTLHVVHLHAVPIKCENIV